MIILMNSCSNLMVLLLVLRQREREREKKSIYLVLIYLKYVTTELNSIVLLYKKMYLFMSVTRYRYLFEYFNVCQFYCSNFIRTLASERLCKLNGISESV